MTSGIYGILNTINKRLYIGMSVNIPNRFRQHVGELNRNIHVNRELQADWAEYGESVFRLDILEEIRDIREMRAAEVEWIARFKNSGRLYNSLPKPNQITTLTLQSMGANDNLINSIRGLLNLGASANQIAGVMRGTRSRALSIIREVQAVYMSAELPAEPPAEPSKGLSDARRKAIAQAVAKGVSANLICDLVGGTRAEVLAYVRDCKGAAAPEK